MERRHGDTVGVWVGCGREGEKGLHLGEGTLKKVGGCGRAGERGESEKVLK